MTLHSLTWTLQFPYDSDTCYLAHCYPYTYSQLQRYLRCISSNPAVASYCTLRVLCHSLAGNAVYVVTITSRGVGRVEGRTKKAVVVTARVHPGETNGSWMMEGFLDFLLGDSEDARLLRDTFVFKVMDLTSVCTSVMINASPLRLCCNAVSCYQFLIWICSTAGGAHAESRWCDSGQLPLFPDGQGPQQKLPDVAQGFLSLCVAHPKHGGKVRQGTRMGKHANILKHVLYIKDLVCYMLFRI